MSEIHDLIRAVDIFTAKMKRRLREKHKHGKRGWNDIRIKARIVADMSNGACAAAGLLTAKASGDLPQIEKLLVDTANRCMMLFFLERQERGNADRG